MMSKFLLVFRGSVEQEKQFSADKMESYMKEWMDWVANMQDKGIYLAGDPLTAEAISIHGKDKLVTDGPYAEAKDLVGGYMLLDMPDLQSAKAEALNCPIYQADGSVEVREIQAMEMHMNQ